MKVKRVYFALISLAVISAFAYLSARLEIHHTEQSMSENVLQRTLLEQQMRRLSPTQQLSSHVPMQLAVLEERLERQQNYLQQLKPYASPWLLTGVLLLWGLALGSWFQVRRQMGLKTQGGWRLWLGRVLFFGGIALLVSAVFLPGGVIQQARDESWWQVAASLLLIVAGVVLRVVRSNEPAK